MKAQKSSKNTKNSDGFFCPSEFLKKKLDVQPRFLSKTVALHNFIEIENEDIEVEKKDYDLSLEMVKRLCAFAKGGEPVEKMDSYAFSRIVLNKIINRGKK